MNTNARLISYMPVVNRLGNGEPVFGINAVAALMPECQIHEPSRRRQDTTSADAVQADMIVTLPRRIFEAAGRRPGVGDRAVLQTIGLLSQTRQGDVVEVRDAAGAPGMIVLTLHERVDNRGGAAQHAGTGQIGGGL